MKAKIIALLSTLSLLLNLLAGCAFAAVPSGDSVKGTAKKHLNISFFWVTTNLDHADSYNGWNLTRMGVGETLLRLDEKAELEPWLADKWENIDELTWKFHIREGVRFHNEKPVDAAAVKRAVIRAFEKNSRAAGYFNYTDIIAEGQNLTIKTQKPVAALAFNICEPLFCIMDDTEGEGAINNKPSGTGPYKVSNFTPERRVDLVKNVNYWDGPPKLDSITFVQVVDSESRVMAMQSGETDLTTTVDFTSLKLFSDPSKYNISSVLGLRANVIYLNNARPLLKERALRRAISFGINREEYTSIVGGKAATGFYSAALPYGNEKLKAYGYDPKLAAKLLDDAGFVDTDRDGVREINGNPIKLQYYQGALHGSSDAALLAQAVQADLLKIGVGVDIISSENLSAIQSAGTFDMISNNNNTAPTGDPLYFLEMMYASGSDSNIARYSNEKIDDIIKRLWTEFDIKKRYDMARQASQILLDDAASLYLNYLEMNTVSAAKVKNAVQFPVDYYLITKDITIE
jgi:peptide/nickel transport system substrate-binding protein